MKIAKQFTEEHSYYLKFTKFTNVNNSNGNQYEKLV